MELVAVRDGIFLRPKNRKEEGGEGFRDILGKVIRWAIHLLILASLIFGGHRLYIRLLEDPLFLVKEVEIQGCERLKENDLFPLRSIEGRVNLFSLNLQSIAKRLEDHPWIEEIKMTKVFPNKILVHIEERIPVAIIQLEEPYYVDKKGVIFAPMGDIDRYNYPILTGLTRESIAKDPSTANYLIMKALELLNIFERERILPMREISEIHMDKIFGLKCFIKDEGIEVKMGWDQFDEKLRRLSIIWSDIQNKGISVVSIDSSDLKRIIVKKRFNTERR